MHSNRCGHTLSVDARRLEIGEMCCCRPTWRDYDRCVWHADVADKPFEEIEKLRPRPGEYIDSAILKGVDFSGVDWFSECTLVGADLTETNLKNTNFRGTNVALSTFDRAIIRHADFTGANLEGAVFRDADLRSADFRMTRLNEAVFVDVYTDTRTNFGTRSVYEIEGVEPVLSDRHRLEAAASSYRALQNVYRDNSLAAGRRWNYIREKDARRRYFWSVGNYTQGFLYSGYRWVMRYGGSPWRVLVTSLVFIVVCGMLYPLTGGIQEVYADQTITYTVENPAEAPRWFLVTVFFKSLYFSLVTFATLGYGDIQPIGSWARTLAGIEAIVGALLAALLVSVLARQATW